VKAIAGSRTSSSVTATAGTIARVTGTMKADASRNA
jgi:hypothetical protein